jgi:hypothetical protein
MEIRGHSLSKERRGGQCWVFLLEKRFLPSSKKENVGVEIHSPGKAVEREVDQSMDLTWKPPRVILLNGQRFMYHIKVNAKERKEEDQSRRLKRKTKAKEEKRKAKAKDREEEGQRKG